MWKYSPNIEQRAHLNKSDTCICREQGQDKDEVALREAAFLRLLSFPQLIYPIDERLTLSGLGYDYGIEPEVARSYASLQYNGNMKPWLELGILDYKKYWSGFLDQIDSLMSAM